MSKYIFAESLIDLKLIAREYGTSEEFIEKALDEFFAGEKNELMKQITKSKYLRIIRIEDIVILQLALKRGRGFSTLKYPWFCVFQKRRMIR